ncbi:MAG: hypothetical protein LH630_04060 [Actinomycetia bacterium]|nr:hypothetical protein [Actinomycetes bacterium]
MPSPAERSATHPEESAGDSWKSGPYCALNHTFVVRTNASDTFQPRLERQLAPLLCPASMGAERVEAHHYRLEDRREPGANRYAVFDNDVLVTTSPSRFVAAGTIHWLANQGAVTSCDPASVQLHAGAVQLAEATLVLPAPMDSGKSTTVAAMVRRGFTYLTDEIVELTARGEIHRSYPKALSLDRSSIDLLGGIPEPFAGAAREPQWHVPAGWLGPAPEPRLPTTVAALIFPVYTPQTASELVPMTPGEAAVSLAESTFRFPERSARSMPVLTNLAEQAPAFRLFIDDLDEGVSALASLVDELT